MEDDREMGLGVGRMASGVPFTGLGKQINHALRTNAALDVPVTPMQDKEYLGSVGCQVRVLHPTTEIRPHTFPTPSGRTSETSPNIFSSK